MEKSMDEGLRIDQLLRQAVAYLKAYESVLLNEKIVKHLSFKPSAETLTTLIDELEPLRYSKPFDDSIRVFASSGFSHHRQAADANCFYFDPIEVAVKLVARPGRIEVSDKDGPLHYHDGATIIFITSGSGMIKTETGDIPVKTGDIILIPPLTKHLSVATHGTELFEEIVYISNVNDIQAVHIQE